MSQYLHEAARLAREGWHDESQHGVTHSPNDARVAMVNMRQDIATLCFMVDALVSERRRPPSLVGIAIAVAVGVSVASYLPKLFAFLYLAILMLFESAKPYSSRAAETIGIVMVILLVPYALVQTIRVVRHQIAEGKKAYRDDGVADPNTPKQTD